MLDLGDPGDADAHGSGDLLLGQAQVLAGLGELVPAGAGEDLPGAGFDLGGVTPALCNSRSRSS